MPEVGNCEISFDDHTVQAYILMNCHACLSHGGGGGADGDTFW